MPKIVMPSTLDTADMSKIIFVDAIGSFLPPLVDAAKQCGLDVTVAEGQINPEALLKYGIVWCSWADQLAGAISYMNLPGKLVVQCRSYEAFTNLPAQIRWSGVSRLVIVANHVLDNLNRRFPGTRQVKTSWLPTCLDMKKWPKPAKWTKVPKQVAWVGRHASPKNSELLALLIDSFPDLTWHIHGPFADGRLESFLRWKFSHFPNVRFFTPTEEEWWKKTTDLEDSLYSSSFILSTSTFESTQVSLMEGMAAGCSPMVYEREGLWCPESAVFKTLDDFRAILCRPLNPDAYRDYVNTHRNMDIHHRCFGTIVKDLAGILSNTPGQTYNDIVMYRK